MPLKGKDALLAELEDVAKENADASALCRLLGFALQGNASAKRARLAGLASGPASRQRLGWLDLVLRAFRAGARSPDDLDSESLEPAQLANGSRLENGPRFWQEDAAPHGCGRSRRCR